MKSLTLLRIASILDGVSLLVLGGAMCFKYIPPADSSWQVFGAQAVSMVGRIHGGLWVALVLLVCLVIPALSWSWKRGLVIVAASVVPFAPFILDRWLGRWGAESMAVCEADGEAVGEADSRAASG